MLIEERNENTRSLSFVSISLAMIENSIPIAQNPGIDWYGGLAAMKEEWLVFHLERAQNSPVFKGIAVGNLSQIIWKRPELSFQRLMGHVIEVTDETGQRHWLNLSSGEPVPEPDIANSEEPIDERLFPEHYPQVHPYFEEVSNFLFQQTGQEASLAIDYLEWKNLILIAWHEKKTSGYIHQLGVFEASGSNVDKFILARDRQGMGRDTFFVANDYLFMVCENTDLRVYK